MSASLTFMRRMMRNIFKQDFVFIIFLVGVSIVASAADMEFRVTELENQMKQVRTETAMETFGAKTATACPEVDGKGWFITADVLYWHARVGGTEFAYTNKDSFLRLPIKGRVKDMDFDWNWGLRAGLGYNFQRDGWDLHAQYTYFDTNGSETITVGQNSLVIPLRGSANIVHNITTPIEKKFLFCTSAKSQYDFEYQGVDLELGCAYYLNRKFSIRPYAGLKSAWFDQEQITRYSGGKFSDGIYGLGPNTVHVTEDCDFWGIGPHGGVDMKWYLGYGVSIFSNLATALLFGRFDVDHREWYSETRNARIRLHANKHAFSPTVQFQLGLRYDSYIFDDKQHIGISLGFETQYWWRQNQMLKVDNEEEKIGPEIRPLFAMVVKYERYSEDIAMYGATLGVKWDF
jgi:hypothetical protein